MNIITDLQLSPVVDDILPAARVLILSLFVLVNRGSCYLRSTPSPRDHASFHPVALTSEVLVRDHRHERILLEGGVSLTGPLVARHLAGAQRVVAAICTVGPELEKAVTNLLGEDPLYALALDGLGNAAVEDLAQQVCGRIGEQVQAEGLQKPPPSAPATRNGRSANRRSIPCLTQLEPESSSPLEA